MKLISITCIVCTTDIKEIETVNLARVWATYSVLQVTTGSTNIPRNVIIWIISNEFSEYLVEEFCGKC